MSGILLALAAIGSLGILSAAALGIAAKIFYVEVDPLVEKIEAALPGANCGGCGQPGCSGAAVAIAQGKMPANGCVAGGAEVGMVIAAIMGVEIKEKEPQIAQVGCRYPVSRADIQFDYEGLQDCRAAFQLYGGPKECPVGCIGMGSCVKSCPFDALSMGPDGLPVVNEEKCTGCGTCVRTCPAGIMRLTSVTDRILGEYDWSQCHAPCQRRCPAGIDIPMQVYLTAKGDYVGALKTIKERNPLPLICGRICPNPCEVQCRRNLTDEPVAINHLKRFVADLEREQGQYYQCYKAPDSGLKTAVIGGGAEGLSSAYFLARLGHQASIFEAREQLGGLLRTVIPESRLPRDVLDWEIQGILDIGVQANLGQAFGREVTLSGLFEDDFQTVFLATGGWDALLMPGGEVKPAPALPQVYLMMPLSMAWAAGKEVELGSRVVVVGNGKEVMSAARKALQKGAKEVTVLSSASPALENSLVRPATRVEKDGITIISQAQVTRLVGVGDRLTELVFTVGEQDEHRISVDTVITASGRLPELIIIRSDRDQEEQVQAGRDVPWHTVRPYRPGRVSPDLFSTGDPVSDFRAVVEAIGGGRRAAASIHHLLAGENLPRLEDDLVHQPARLDVECLENLIPVGLRNQMPETSPEERLDPNREIALGYSEEQAMTEAKRCLNCGLICYYRTQYH